MGGVDHLDEIPLGELFQCFFFSNSGILTHSFVRDGSLLTSKQVQTHRLGFQHDNMDALPIVSTHLGFRTRPQPGRITRVNRQMLGAITKCGVDPFHDILGIGCEN